MTHFKILRLITFLSKTIFISLIQIPLFRCHVSSIYILLVSKFHTNWYIGILRHAKDKSGLSFFITIITNPVTTLLAYQK